MVLEGALAWAHLNKNRRQRAPIERRMSSLPINAAASSIDDAAGARRESQGQEGERDSGNSGMVSRQGAQTYLHPRKHTHQLTHTNLWNGVETPKCLSLIKEVIRKSLFLEREKR